MRKIIIAAAAMVTDPDHFWAYTYIATYGWHSDCGTTPGPQAQFCPSGSFGAYSFSEEAFNQAKKLFVIHGTIDAGSNILADASYAMYVPEADGSGIVGSSSGYHSTVVRFGKGAFDATAVGYTVGSLTYCEKYGNHNKYCDEGGLSGAKVVKFIDGGHVQIDKKAKHDAEMYGLVIAPPDYVDMCQCTLISEQWQ